MLFAQPYVPVSVVFGGLSFASQRLTDWHAFRQDTHFIPWLSSQLLPLCSQPLRHTYNHQDKCHKRSPQNRAKILHVPPRRSAGWYSNHQTSQNFFLVIGG